MCSVSVILQMLFLGFLKNFCISTCSAVMISISLSAACPGLGRFLLSGARATDCDATLISATDAWTTAVERPGEGGTLLATQRWSRDAEGGVWRLATHRYIPWSADGATAVAALRCDGRGCVLLGRQINTRAP